MKNILLISLFLISISLFGELTDFQSAYFTSFAQENGGKYDEAIKTLLEIEAKYKYDYELNFRLGWLYYATSKFSESEKYIKKAISIKENSIEAKSMYLLTLTGLKKWDDIEQITKQIYKQSPNDYYTHIRHAYALYLQQKYETALTHYEILYSYYPSDLSVKLGIAATLFQMKKYDKAKQFYIEVLKISPYHETAYIGYLECMKKL